MMLCRILGTIAAIWLAVPAFATIEIKEVTSPGGITAWLVEDHTIPFVALDIRFKGGTALDEEDTRGAIHLMTALLEEGAAEMDAQAFAKAAEGLAASFSFDAFSDAIVINAQMLTENRDAAAGLLRDALIAPRFDPAAIERVRAQVLSMIESNAKDPDEVARATFDALAFGTHPYGTPQEGTTESATALTRDDMLAAHSAVFARDRIHVGAAGDITAEELGLLLDRLVGDLPAVGAPMPKDAPYLLEGGTTVVDFPTPQSVALFGQQGIERDDPEFFAAFVLNQILGGGNFRSRLMQEVRVDRGLTYGIYSYLSLADYAPMIMGQFSSSNDLVSEAVAVTREQWADLAENGITEAELEAAKLFLTGAYPLRFDGNSNIAGILAGMQADGMAMDYITDRNAKIEAVTLDDVRMVAARLLRPEHLHFVVVGQPEGLETGN